MDNYSNYLRRAIKPKDGFKCIKNTKTTFWWEFKKDKIYYVNDYYEIIGEQNTNFNLDFILDSLLVENGTSLLFEFVPYYACPYEEID